ncbi:MAG: hypothetical protein CSB47_09425 [Proteobacteria bacterium]|nr:MAG: hypothetical protein CSB47_09425 [Pseudomonadota bacterium]
MKASKLSLLALAAAFNIFLTGCNDDGRVLSNSSKASAKPSSLSTFLSLHEQFCEKEFKNRDALVQALEKDKRFRPAAGFMGVYETTINKISYAVSPEIDGCTTDVMVQNETTGKLLFSYDEVNAALINHGYRVLGAETTRKDIGANRQEVTIRERTFMSPAGEVTNLDYPSDRPDKYYTTLFAKKFPATGAPASLSLK